MDIVAGLDLSPDKDLLARYKGVGPELDVFKPYLVVLQHPVTTEYGSGFEQINQTLGAIKSLNMQTVWLWPNVDAGSDDISKGLRVFRENEKPDYIHFYRHFSVEDYARLIANCVCVVGNSSSGIREGSFLGVPSVNIGTRQAYREKAENCISVGYNHEEIEAAIRSQLENGHYAAATLYGDGKAGERIAEILSDTPINIQKRLMY